MGFDSLVLRVLYACVSVREQSGINNRLAIIEIYIIRCPKPAVRQMQVLKIYWSVTRVQIDPRASHTLMHTKGVQFPDHVRQVYLN